MGSDASWTREFSFVPPGIAPRRDYANHRTNTFALNHPGNTPSLRHTSPLPARPGRAPLFHNVPKQHYSSFRKGVIICKHE